MLKRLAKRPPLPAAFLVIYSVFLAAGVSASNSPELYQAEFIAASPIPGSADVVLSDESTVPVMAYVEDATGRKYAARFHIDGNRITVSPPSGSQDTRRIIVLFQADSPEKAIENAAVSVNGVRLPGTWGIPTILTTGILTDVTDSLALSTVAVADTHTVGFTTSTVPLSDSGVIWVIFPEGFGLEGIDHALYWDNDPANDGNEPSVAWVSIIGDAVQFHLSYSGEQAVEGSRIWVKFWPDTNATVAQDYNVIVMTTRYDGEIDNSPVVSAPFTLQPGPLYRVLVQPDSPMILQSDSLVQFMAFARDSYGNTIRGIAFNYVVTVDSCGQVSSGLFRALRLGTCYVTASAGGLIDSSGLITVIPGPLSRFTIRGQPDSLTAGSPFRSAVTVVALDSQGNRKYDYLDSIWFATSDPIDDLPFEPGNPYYFTPSDAGSHAFAGAGFVLKRSGPRRYLMVSNGLAGGVSDPIRVSPAVIDSLAMSVGLTQIAGESFNVQVYNARDAYRNPASGVVIVSDSVGGGDSPDGIPPSLNNIIVTNGSGSALQTLTNADSTMLMGTVGGGSFIATTPLFAVLPGELGRYSLSNYPGMVTAGAAFSGVTLAVSDIFGNLKTNYDGYIYFTSSDSNATLPYDQTRQFHFLSQFAGVHSFPESFILKTAGEQTLTITNGVTSASTQSIAVRPDVMTHFSISGPSTAVAGIPFALTASDCRDQWGNLADGVVIVSDSVGGGDSPDGIPPSLNNITVTNGSGSALQTLTNADSTMLKGTVGGGSFIATTPLFAVLPGELGRYSLSNYPGMVTAGAAFSGVTLTVSDIFGNLKTNYDGYIYFTSSDTIATLPYDQTRQFHFLSQFAGVHSFPESFALKTAGEQTLTITNSVISASTQSIAVRPDVMTHFSISGPSTAVAGVLFALTASDCRDQWGNLADGFVIVSDSVGGRQSPNGTPPVFTPIPISLGAGSAYQTLFNAVATRLKGTAGSVVSVTDSIDVAPGTLGSFVLSISSPQVSGISFSGTASLTANDLFGNAKSNYDASADTVVISSTADGLMSNNVLNLPTDFVRGTANLVTEQTTYRGRGGPMSFMATSQSGVIGVSGPVDMSAIFCQDLLIDQAVITLGDTATGTISVQNSGGVVTAITDLIVFDDAGWITHPFTNPRLPDSIGAGQARTYNILLPIPTGLNTGYHRLTCAARAAFGPYVVSDTLLGFPETIFVESSSRPAYVSGSLSPLTLSTGEFYTLSLSLQDTGNAGLALIDTSYLQFSDGVYSYRANISSGVFLPPHTPGVTVILDSALVDARFAGGRYATVLHYYGMENSLFVTGIVTITDSILVQTRASISYAVNSLQPESLVASQIVSFSIGVQNTGSADFILRHSDTRISFGDSERRYLAFSDTSASVRVDTISTGDTTLHFARLALSSDFPAGMYLPHVIIAGSQNRRDQLISFDTTGDSVKVLSPASVRIDSTYSMARNAPLVNTSQPCSIRVVVQNLGDEAVDSLLVNLASTGQSIFPESTMVPHLNGHRGLSLVLPCIASTAPNDNEVFATRVLGGKGSVSGNPVSIQQPLDNIALLVIETPASLALSPISIVGPPEALDDTVSIGQSVTISATVHNLGQAAVEGRRQLALDTLSSGFIVRDSIIRDYDFDVPVFWEISAPQSQRSRSLLRVRFLAFPVDANNGLPAVGADSVRSIAFVVNNAPTISQRPMVTWPAGARDRVVSTDQVFVITDSLNAGGIYRDLTVSLALPSGYSTEDSLIRHPAGGVVSWRLRAPGVASSNDTISVSSWLYDVNTGDSISAGSYTIVMTTVDAAALQIATRLAGPAAALDGVVEPGGQIQFEAVVLNRGQAVVGPGQMILETGHPDFIPVESHVRDFTTGVPVNWTISLPDSEISLPALISARILAFPVEENTGEPARAVLDSSAVTILVKKLLPRLVLFETTGHSGSAVKGMQLTYLTFSLQNTDPGGNHAVGITGFSFAVHSNPSAAASGLLSNSSIISDFGAVAGTLSGDTIRFSLPDTVYLAPSSRLQFRLLLNIKPNTLVRDFTLSFDDSFIDAVAVEDGMPTSALTPVMPRGEPVSWQGDPTAILEATFSGSISSYPNPFNPRTGGARIGYYLATDSELDVRIFTLLGELVWSKAISSADPLASRGFHTGSSALTWDGKNDAGHEIRSGVYICIIRNITTGEEEKFKIAIVK